MANDWTDGNTTGLWSDPLNWSLGHVPAAAEDVTFASSTDACSVDVDIAAINSITISVNVTITVNAAQTTTFGAMAISATGVFDSNGQSTITITSLNISTTTAYLVMGASNWSCSGNWTSSSTSGSYNVGTSTVTFTANGNINTAFLASGNFYNATINNGVTSTNTGTYIGITNVLTVNGTAAQSAGTFQAYVMMGTGNTIVLGGSYTYSTSLYYYNGGAQNIPAMTVGHGINIENTDVTLAGNIIISGLCSVASQSIDIEASGGHFNTTGYSVTATNGIYFNTNNPHMTCGASIISCASVTLLTSGSYLTMNTSTWNVAGNWTSASTSVSYNVGTSTVTFTNTANISTSALINNFYNITFSTGKTYTVTGGYTYFSGVCTFNGTADVNCNANMYVSVNSASAITNPFVVSGSEQLTGCNIFVYAPTVNVILPAWSVAILDLEPNVGKSITFNGTTTCTYMYLLGQATTSQFNFNGQTITSTDVTTGIRLLFGYITCSAANVTCAIFRLDNSATAYVDWGSSSWLVSGNFTNISTSASWSYGTSTIDFNGTLTQTLGLNNGNSANIGYYNITISNSGAVNVVMGANNISIHGAFNISSATCTVTEAANNPTYTISGNITKANGSTWTRGTGLMTINGSSTMTDNGFPQTDLKNVTVNAPLSTVTLAAASFSFSGTFRIQNGIVQTVNATAYVTLVQNGTWTKMGGAVNTVAFGTLQIDVGTTYLSGDLPPSLAYKHIGGYGGDGIYGGLEGY